MKDKNRGSAGGKATAIIEKERAKQRIDEYNMNPNHCLCCGEPIAAPYDKKLYDILVKKFCNHSCAAKYNNLNKVRNKSGFHNPVCIIDNFSDEEIVDIFNNSSSLTDFSIKLGYKYKINKDNKAVIDRLLSLNLNIDDLINNINVNNLTKQELFEQRYNWQSARSNIQKLARKNYQNSDKPKQCIICGYDKHYEVAHIKAVCEFDNNALISEINSIDNLIALCPNHHWEYDNNNLDISQYL